MKFIRNQVLEVISGQFVGKRLIVGNVYDCGRIRGQYVELLDTDKQAFVSDYADRIEPLIKVIAGEE